jgi:peptidyl-prolyl cis-trans isomerase C
MVMEQFAAATGSGSGVVTFADLARDFSTCPSGKQAGGSLGSFSPGTMVKEFDDVIFNPETELGKVLGPVQTKFGYHIIVVDKRTGV